MSHRVGDFFALDADWVRRPAAVAQRQDATITLVPFVLSRGGLKRCPHAGAPAGGLCCSLNAQRSWPPAAPDHPVDLDPGVKQLVDSAAAGLVLAAPTELDDTDVRHIGRPVRWGRRKLRLREVDPEGGWRKSPRGTESRRSPELISAGCTKRISRSSLEAATGEVVTYTLSFRTSRSRHLERQSSRAARRSVSVAMRRLSGARGRLGRGRGRR